MLSALIRLLAMAALAVAVVLTVLDAARSIARDALVLTPLAELWASVHPGSLEAFSQTPSASYAGPVLSAPAMAVFAGLFLLLYLIGHAGRRRRPR